MPKGGLETWIPNLHITGHGNTWVINFFDKLRKYAEKGREVEPSNDDVWKFIDLISEWLKNPERSGMKAS